MIDADSRSAFNDNFYYIKGKHRRLLQQTSALEIIFSATMNFSLLCRCHGLYRSAEPGRSTRLDLYEADTATFFNNKINLTITMTAKVAG